MPNWNGPGRNDIYNDPRFNHMWWLEINWTYNGMFSGEGPTRMFEKLSRYGKMGRHIREVTREHPWARYFRVGDTPSVLYLIDPSHDPDNPEESSWAGKFKKPFPQKRPHYYTDDNGTVEWDYEDPCNTWHNLEEMYAYNKSTLEKERPEMYEALLEKLERIYDSMPGSPAYVSLEDVTVTDSFWGPKLETNRRVTIPHNFEMCEKTGVVDNFKKAAGLMEGEARGLILWDNALYKTMEAASCALMQEYDEQLDMYLDSLIVLIGSAQQKDGYLKTDEILAKEGTYPDTKRWKRPWTGCERMWYSVADGDVRLAMEAELPGSGDIKLKVLSVEPEMFTLHIRVPHWAKQDPVPGDLYEYFGRSHEAIPVRVNGENLDVDPDNGYITLDRRWKAGDEIRIGFPLEVRRVISHPAVKENQGKVALERGPFVYCFEEMDNPEDIFSILIPDTAGSTAGHLRVYRSTCPGAF